ncbi:hypothetical protein GLOIN_2v1773797 [Rhizophagus clarus]|uniref:Uncharacterized protein n=1 Tax=Rhizophagus clarus TaxID=94130 RepID=A0A8H3LT31_9GLOM|nr:hypothetical protein GLOIN_2v1773797 [Rhizophagus clarus]
MSLGFINSPSLSLRSGQSVKIIVSKDHNYTSIAIINRRKLEKGVKFDDDDFLYLPNQLDDDKSGDGDKSEDQPDDDKSEVIISKIDLLRNKDDLYFNFNKEKAIKILSRQIGKIYDKIKEEYIEAEIKRRQRFRFYVNILNIQRKIENYCCLYRTKNKGETIKSQLVNKIIQYNSNITHNNLKNILKAARRIESLIKVANDNWGIIDTFLNVDINFFKLTSINVNNYEQWLNLIETGKTILEEEGKMIYLIKKKRENQSRKDELKNIYHQANITDSSDILSNINWEDE